MSSYTYSTYNDFSFDIIHSIPVITHSAALANRTPTSNYGQATRFMPDFGGILETPNEILKNNALSQGIPFSLISGPIQLKSKSADDLNIKNIRRLKKCLVATSHLGSAKDDLITLIRAIGNHLYLDLLEEINLQPSANQYATKTFQDPIQFIKYDAAVPELLPVGFTQNVKALKLNSSYNPRVQCEDISSNLDRDPILEPATQDIATVKETDGFYIKDACFNRFNKSLLSVASDNYEECQVRIYDISKPSKSFYLISWPAPSMVEANVNPSASPMHLRNRKVRRFVPVKPAVRGIQQVENIPSHLVNLFVTNDYQTVLIDPRSDCIGQIYVDKTQVPSFYPVEYLRKTQFSQHNSYQFYSLSNVHLRVFDTRYPGTPMNQLNHMLDSDSYSSMEMKSISYHENKLETLCLSSPERNCFVTFDRCRNSQLVNPKSVHMPYHENPPRNELYGLAVYVSEPGDQASTTFRLMQISDRGHIFHSRYSSSIENQTMDIDIDIKTGTIIEKIKTCDTPSPIEQSLEGHAGRDVLQGEYLESELELLDIVDMKLNPLNTNSQRALDRYNKMLSKLDWC